MIVKKLAALGVVLFCFLRLSVFGFSGETELQIKESIKAEYLREYPSISIANVKIEIAAKMDTAGYRYKSIEPLRQNLNKSVGVASVTFESAQKTDKKIFVKYEIDASLEVLKAAYNIQKDKIITSSDTTSENIKFKNFFAKPLSKEQLKNVVAKRFIRAATVLTALDIAGASSVKRGSVMYAVISQDFLDIELEATTLEDGNVGDTINVKTKSGKVMKAYISSPSKLEIR